MLKQFKASMMDKNNEHQLDKNQKSKKKKKIKPLHKKLLAMTKNERGNL